MLSWDDVIKCFEESDYEILQTINNAQEYWNEKTLYKGMIADDDTILYIANSSQIPSIEFRNNVTVLILKDNNFCEEEIPDHVGNVLCVAESGDVPKGIIQLNSKFQDQFKVGYMLSLLQTAIVNNEGIQCIIEMLSKFFQEPVALLDTTFRFIAKSKTNKPSHEGSMYSNIHDEEGFDKRLLDLLKKEGVLDKFIHMNESFSHTIGNEKVYFTPIMISKIKVAFLVIYTKKPENMIEEQYQIYFPLFSNMLSIEMAKDNFYLFNKGNYFNYIFSLILSDEKVDFEDIQMRLKIYDYDLREYMYLVKIDTDMYRDIGLHKDRIADSIRRTFRNSFYVFKNDKIYFLISRAKKDLVTKEEVKKWDVILKSQKLIAAFTGPFVDLKNMKKHLKEVELVLDVVSQKQTEESIFSFEEYQIPAMISALQKEENLDIFLYKPVLELIEYDKQNGTVLVQTLQEFLRHPKNISEICEVLCIHKNTLYKRLDKIDSIMKCDYRNGAIIMKIELTFEMLEMR